MNKHPEEALDEVVKFLEINGIEITRPTDRIGQDGADESNSVDDEEFEDFLKDLQKKPDLKNSVEEVERKFRFPTLPNLSLPFRLDDR